jgi:hypothetical protein
MGVLLESIGGSRVIGYERAAADVEDLLGSDHIL